MTQPVTVLAQTAAVFRREVAVERAGREALVTTAPFVAAFVVLAGLGFGPGPQQLAATAGGTVWLAVLVATVPLARTVAGAEMAEESWDVLRGLVAPNALFAGKLLATWGALALTWVLAGALVAVLFEVPVPPAAIYGGALGTLALAALTTTFGVLVDSGARRGGLLAALMLPTGLPVLLAGTQLTVSASAVLPWGILMTLYAGAVLTAAWAVFPVLLEE
ncbi:heme exporter protein CcmB [Blastococcus saxobsidens]|uniref:Putative Heme exporter protein B n=1 Tax=Blastococcus saxobsidens (strain DD2) TaxID=1146883 RepID=H6RNL0_BLASD|nr:heme exporter protein CcmB [Blastococcus saxobsidens]CCG03957.1 putative Heme exporter protein B [Blastococcus saxobsidens DD2]